MTERQLVTKILKALKKVPCLFCYKVHDMFTSGVPDILVCYKGHFVGLEVKTPIGKESRIQKYVIKQINDAGGKACVVRSVNEALWILNQIDMGV